jgi:hypothetical protein
MLRLAPRLVVGQIAGATCLVLASYLVLAASRGLAAIAPLPLLLIAAAIVEAALAPIYFGAQRAMPARWPLFAWRAACAIAASTLVRVVAVLAAAAPGMALACAARTSGSAALRAAADAVGAGGCAVAFLGAMVFCSLASRIAGTEGVRAFDAVTRSVAITRRRWIEALAAHLLVLASAACITAATRLVPLLALAVVLRLASDIALSRLLRAPVKVARRRPVPRLRIGSFAPAMLALVVIIARADVASAQMKLVTPSDTAIETPSGTRAVRDGSKATGAAGPDTIVGVVEARARTSAAFMRLTQARIAARDAALNHGDIEAARREVELAQKALTQASASVRTALEANEAATQKLERQEEIKVYGPDGPSTLQRTGAGLSTAGGVVTGMGEGTVVGAWDSVYGLGYALFHPVETVKNIGAALNAPMPTPEQLAAEDALSLERERSQRLAQVSAPFAVGRDGGYIIGHDLIGPVAGGEAIGIAGTLAKKGIVSLGARVSAKFAERAGPIEVSGLEQMSGPRPKLEYPADTPVFRAQPAELPLLPHKSEYFNPLDYGLPWGDYEALYVSTDRVALETLRREQGDFAKGATLMTSTLGDLVKASGPGTRVFVDFRLPDHSIIIVRPAGGQLVR